MDAELLGFEMTKRQEKPPLRATLYSTLAELAYATGRYG